MSALGQKQTYAAQQVMSALPPIATAKADSCRRSCLLYPKNGHVRCTSSGLLWALSGHETNLVCHSYSMTASARARTAGGIVRPSSLAVFKIDHQLVLGRRLHWKVTRFLALEDAIRHQPPVGTS